MIRCKNFINTLFLCFKIQILFEHALQNLNLDLYAIFTLLVKIDNPNMIRNGTLMEIQEIEALYFIRNIKLQCY